jgi:hypothetical protein
MPSLLTFRRVLAAGAAVVEDITAARVRVPLRNHLSQM